MITISVKKNVFACLVIAIVFILSLYQYCENKPERCFYLSVAEAPKVSLVGNYMQINASKKVSGHAKWLQNDGKTTDVPTTIDTLQKLLKMAGRVKSIDQTTADNELKRIERVDMEEVRDEEKERKEAKLLGIDEDRDNKSLGYREEDFLRRDLEKEMSAKERNRNRKRNWLESRHSQQNLERYERVDKTILDPGAMTKQELEEFYNKTINSSSLFLLSVGNKTKSAQWGPISQIDSIQAPANSEVDNSITRPLVSGMNNRGIVSNGEITQVNTSNAVGNSSNYIIGKQTGILLDLNETIAQREVLFKVEKALKIANESEILSMYTNRLNNQTSSSNEGEVVPMAIDLHDSEYNATEKGSDFNKRSNTEQGSKIVSSKTYEKSYRVDSSRTYNVGSYRNEQSRKVVVVNVTHDDSDESEVIGGNEENSGYGGGDYDENEASSSTQSGERIDEMTQDVTKDTKSGKHDPLTSVGNIEDESINGELRDDNTSDGDDQSRDMDENNADSAKNGKNYGKSGTSRNDANGKEGSPMADEEADKLEDDAGSVDDDNGDDDSGEEGPRQPYADAKDNGTVAAITKELDNTDKFEEEEKLRNTFDDDGSSSNSQEQYNAVKESKKHAHTRNYQGQKHNRDRYHTKLKKKNNEFFAVKNSILTRNTTHAELVNSENETDDGAQRENGRQMDKNQSKLNDSMKYRKSQKTIKIEPKSWLMYHKDVSCLPLDPKLLLYNRIFKTGSTSINEYLKDEWKRHFFQVKIGTTEDWYKTGLSYPYPHDIEKFANKSKRRRVYSGHFFFRDKLNISRPYTYINQVREPLDRILSHYFYMRNSTARPKARINEMKAAGEYNETLRECFVRQHRGCENNVMTHFFCGKEPFCNTGSEKAIQRAKYNMLHYYSAIGLTEKLDLYLKILKKRLPKYFRMSRVLPREKSSKNGKFFATVTEELKARIKNANFADYQIYEYARYLFNKQLEACKLRTNS